ncbi:unnamed protein product [Musa acuminata subsp. malaccensis]|uniref:(wild Malaysian banana) hypothetical protein n=1 Tax=Musa acuminata subsp. malaccensis TaxID=214687 RepID=A0A804KY37_MUSAM|nr:unnamed protein product [Musa acuminata subsp. malaccensis]
MPTHDLGSSSALLHGKIPYWFLQHFFTRTLNCLFSFLGLRSTLLTLCLTCEQEPGGHITPFRGQRLQILHHCLAFYDDIYRRNEQEKVKAGGRIRQVTDAISALHVNGDTIEDLIIKQAAQSSISLPLQPKSFAKITRGG